MKMMRPKTLKAGEPYFYITRDVRGHPLVGCMVKFIDYDPCPAFVIIEQAAGSRIRCSRDDLFGIITKAFIAIGQQNSAQFLEDKRKPMMAQALPVK